MKSFPGIPGKFFYVVLPFKGLQYFWEALNSKKQTKHPEPSTQNLLNFISSAKS